MTQELLERINFLAKKSKAEGLTEEEKQEQQALRAEYIREFRQGVSNTLDNTYIMDENGNKRKLEKKGLSTGDVMKMRFYTPVYGVAKEFGCATLGFAGAEDASLSKSELYPVELSGKVIYGTYDDCLNQIEKGDWKAGIVLFGNGGNENDFMGALSEKLKIPFVGGSAATNSETGENRLVFGRNQVALFLIDDDRYEFEAVCENIHSEILGTYTIGISDSRWIESIDGNDAVKWLEEKKNELGFSPDDFEHLTFSDEYGINAHLSKVDGRIFSGRDLSEKMILRYVPKSEVQARIQKFYDDKDAIIFGCAGLKGILDEGLHTKGLGLFMFGEVCTIKNHSDFGNLMLSKLRIVKKDR